MTSAVEQNIIRFIKNHNLLVEGDKLLIAFSGGPDSLFALWFFNKFQSKFKISIAALHINHSLREKDSDEDERFCELYCKENKIEFFSEKVDVKSFADENKQSIEEAARNIRYTKFNEFATKLNATKIVTAHNLDDNTETVLLNLLRGSGLKGLGGIPIQRDNIIRPLLSTSKKDVLEILDENNIKFRIDKSNLESDFSRNYLRNEILPKLKEKINPALDLNIQRFSEIAKESNTIINSIAEDISSKFIVKTEKGLDISEKLTEGKNEKYFNIVVRQSIERAFNIVPTFEDVLQIKNLFELQVGGKINLSEKLFAIRERNYINITRDLKLTSENKEHELYLNRKLEIDGKVFFAEISNKDESNFSTQNNVEYINGDFLTFPLKIRKWKDRDAFQPLRLKGKKKVSDFLTESKVSSLSRKNSLLLLNQDKIIWLINKRIDESIKITKETKRIIKLWVK